MTDLVKTLELPLEYSEETLYVKRMKETLVANPQARGKKICYTMKLPQQLHGAIMAAAAKHGMPVTDIVVLHLEQILPVLQKAKAIDVPGYKKDLRVNPLGRR